jgi:hypothetical protein
MHANTVGIIRRACIRHTLIIAVIIPYGCETERAFRTTSIPLCFSELGYLTPDGYGPLPSGFAWASGNTIEEQATWLRDAVEIAASFSSVRIALIIVWNVDFDVYTEDDPQAGYAIIRPDGSCPACETIGSLISDGQG